MATVREKERQAEQLAHVLDDALVVPGTTLRLGLDPILGCLPLIGDTLATAAGVAILLTARQLQVPPGILVRMAYHLTVNGIFGAFPVFGDLFSIWYRSNSKNAALLLRGVSKSATDACPLVPKPLSGTDLALVLLMTTPALFLTGYVSFLLWDWGSSLISPFGEPLPRTPRHGPT
jgi:hypothetical protein